MKLTVISTCPRCTGAIPSNKTPGAYPGAVSRADGETEICSACGADEAIRVKAEGEIIGRADWPMIDAHHYAKQGGAA